MLASKTNMRSATRSAAAARAPARSRVAHVVRASAAAGEVPGA
jgi:hypothetical protein